MNPSLSSPPIKILVVDDTPDTLGPLVDLLNQQGYLTQTATNGQLALAVVQKISPDLVLLAIDLPEMNGYELCQRLKADDRTSQIPVIFLSAWTEGFDAAKAFAMGAADYISKPVQVEEALVRIQTQLTLCSLQQMLQQRNEDLAFTQNQLKITQYQLIQAEKMVALGHLVANVAHEINTPLGAIRSSAEGVNHFLTQNLQQLVRVLQSIDPERQQLFYGLLQRSIEAIPRLTTLSSREKRHFKRLLIQRLTAEAIPNADVVADTLVDIGVYDQIEPFLALLTQSQGQQMLDTVYQLVSLQKSTRTILSATDQATRTVSALKRYIHQDASGRKIETDLIEGIETALTLHLNQIKRGVEVVRHYLDVPEILAFPDELNQVWTNLLSNALYSMENQGTLTITVCQVGAEVRVDISDTGQGIPSELQAKIFEPFFTTKPKGEGSGLGLNIVKKIVDRHAGQIRVDSRPGCTTFSVFLPLTSPPELLPGQPAGF